MVDFQSRRKYAITRITISGCGLKRDAMIFFGGLYLDEIRHQLWIFGTIKLDQSTFCRVRICFKRLLDFKFGELKSKIYLSNEENAACLGHIGDCTTPIYVGIIVNQYIWIPIKQPV